LTSEKLRAPRLTYRGQGALAGSGSRGSHQDRIRHRNPQKTNFKLRSPKCVGGPPSPPRTARYGASPFPHRRNALSKTPSAVEGSKSAAAGESKGRFFWPLCPASIQQAQLFGLYYALALAAANITFPQTKRVSAREHEIPWSVLATTLSRLVAFAGMDARPRDERT
jgi:hypothetical protein